MLGRTLERFGYVKVDNDISVSRQANHKYEFGSKSIRELLLANIELFPVEVQQEIKSGKTLDLSVVAKIGVDEFPYKDMSCGLN